MTDADDRRMTEAEGLIWRLESEPAFGSSFATVTLLDRPADLARLRRRMQRAVALVPRLRQRVQERPFGLPPVWVDVEDVDLHHHIRPLTLASPGTLRQVLDQADELLAHPFDLGRPLWEFVVIDGLEDHSGAIVQKMHHTLTDGENGLRLSLQFVDIERDGPEPEELTDEELAAAAPRPPPTPADTMVEAMGNGLRLGSDMLRELAALALDPGRLPQLAGSLRKQIGGTVGTLTDTTRAASPLWSRRSLERHVEVLQAPFHPVKEAAEALGGTVNVAFLTATAAATGAYHRELGAPVDALRASMAISTRRRDSGANAFTLARLTVPTGELPVRERFARIREAADDARAGAAGGVDLTSLAAVAAALPTPVIVHLAKQQTGAVDFATSNLRASPFPVYLAGARIRATYPIGPLAGVALNLTLMSYSGSLDMGLHVDPAAVTEPARLRARLEDAFDDLVAAARKAPKKRARAAGAKTTKKKPKRAKAG